jgi:hypothetical protein
MGLKISKKSLRSWWRNCALEPDYEILEIDKKEDGIAPISEEISKIRELISSFELCHHKARQWIHNIIEAIGTGRTTKGLGTRSPEEQHPFEKVWQNACAALNFWCAGCPSSKIDLNISTLPASQLLSCLGERSPLKEWQVQRVVDKIRTHIHWPHFTDHPMTQYQWILLSGGEYESFYRKTCPKIYIEHEDFWQKTAKTIIHDNIKGEKTDLSLGLAIDMLWPCHWNFVQNLHIVLQAIGGRLNPQQPFAACGRNIAMLPYAAQLKIVSNTLKVFCGNEESSQHVDQILLILLGKHTQVKRWLAASLEKTIRLQLYPPSQLMRMSSLAGPEWIKQ